MNEKIFYYFYNFSHQSLSFDRLIVFIAQTLPYIVILAVFVFLLWHHDVLDAPSPIKEFVKKWKEIFFVFFVSAGAWSVSKILKLLIQSPRPFDAYTNVQNLVVENGYGFPSGHSTFFMALAVSMLLIHKRVGYVFFVLAILIGIARIFAGVHFPGDIIGGFALGAGIAYLIKNV
jgi:membrane-associated phospholipid phosphatase